MMNRPLYRRAVVLFFVLLAAWMSAARGEKKAESFAPGQVIIKFKPSAPRADAQAVRSSLHATVKKQFKSIDAELWQLSGMSVEEAVNRYKDDPRVAFVEPNYVVHADDLLPNDPRFGQLWGLHNTGQSGGTPDADIDAPEAWSIGTGGTVLVGVIDTGVDWHHVDLAANIYTNPAEIPDNGIDDDHNDFVDDVHGWDFVNWDNDPYDDHGHGTHVSGTIAAVGNNGTGVVGVCWSARIMPLKFLDYDGYGYTSDAVLAVEYATRMGARLTSNSWGGGGYSTALRDAIATAGNQGILFIAAAGNDGSDNDDWPHYPSNYDLDNIISVASTDRDDQRSGFSNYGLISVDLGAPGSDILSTFPNNSYGTISGTSMATPHVSGAVALAWATEPTMTGLEVKNAILSTVDPLPALAGKVVSGGRLNVHTMMASLDDVPPAGIRRLTVASTGSTSAMLTWVATGDDSTIGTATTYDLRYSTARISARNFDAATRVPGTPHPKPARSPESFEVTGLNYNTRYYFAIVAEDEQGNRSRISDPARGTTLGIPHLAYSPGTFTADLHTGGTVTRALTLTNTAAGTLDFETDAAPAWAWLNPPSGRVNAGQSMQVSVVFDATHLSGGAYDSTLTLATNDPAQQTIVLLVSLRVTDAADIVASPTTLDFGVHYTSTCATDTVVITNIGTLTLDVTGIGVDNPEFTTDTSAFSVEPGQSRVLPIEYCPVSVATLQATLSLQSNDPDHPIYAVSIRGQGVDPPIIAVTPSSLSADLFTGGVSAQTLSIANQGGSDLSFEIAIEDLGGPTSAAGAGLMPDGQGRREKSRDITPATASRNPARSPSYAGNHTGSLKGKSNPPSLSGNLSLSNMRILLLLAGGASEIRYALQSFPDISVVDEFDGLNATPTLATLLTYDAVILINDYAFMEPGPIGDVLADYVDQGGGVIMSIASFISGWDVRGRFANDGYFPFTLGSGPVGWASLANFDPGHRIMAGVVEASGDLLGATSLAPGAEWVADWDNGYPFIATQGRHVVGVNAFLVDGGYWGGDMALILHNAAAWVTGASWLSIEPKKGVVAAGGAVDVAVTFTAASLDGGNYASNLRIAHNDLIHPTMVVPAALHVTGAPDIALSEMLLDYGPQFIGAAIKDTLVVSNDGTDLLTVSSISSSHSNYTVDISNFSLAPFTSQNVVVTFAATATGPISGSLAIASNDFDEGALTVELRGVGVEPPIISVAPASLSADLITGGESNQSITISNTGVSDLDFEISMEETGSPGANVDVFGISVSSDVIAVGHPLSRAELQHLKTSFPRQVTVPAPGEIDRGQPSRKRQGESTLERARTRLEEVFGSDENEFFAGPRTRGNLFTCTTSTTLREHRFYVDPSRSTEMWFLVYEGMEQVGAYDLISASNVTPAGPGLGWYSSGEINVELLEGRYYMIVASYQQETSYFNEQYISPYPIPASFGELTAGAGWGWAPTANFPPDPVQDVPYETFGEPVAYYQTLVTGGYVRWLSVEPEAGTVHPGTPLDIGVRFDAAGLFGGDYDADIRIESNDPITPVFVVPAHLHVTGAPDISASDSLLDYGPQFIGAAIKKTLVVTNDGTDLLTVTSISSSQPTYTVDMSSFTVAPMTSQNVVVTFAPTAVGPVLAVLTITSDDPDEGVLTVDLAGAGVEPPVIAVAPPSLSEDLLTGQTATHLLTISNSGESELSFSIVFEDLGGPAPPETTVTQFERERAGTVSGSHVDKGHVDTHSYPPMKRSSGGPDAFGYRWRDSNTPGGPSFDWVDVSGGTDIRLWDDDFSPDIPLGFTFRYYGTEFTTVGVGSNGWLSFNGWEQWYPYEVPREDYYEGAIAPFARDLYPELGSYIRYQTFGTEPRRQFVVEYNNIPDFEGGNRKTFEVIFNEGTNSIRFQYLKAPNLPYGFGIESPDQTMGIGNGGEGDLFLYPGLVRDSYAIEFTVAPRWLQTQFTDGTVPPHGSVDMPVTFNAAGMFGGDYAANILVDNNDPIHAEVVVPVQLHVTGAPDIAVSDSLLDFGWRYIGTIANRTLVVSNEGTDPLTVSSIVSNHADFAADTTAFMLAPGDSQSVVVTFAPTSAGIIATTLSISSNDADEGLVEVELRGEGVSPPVIAVTPVSLYKELLTNQTSTEALTIDNTTGGSNLVWTLAVQPPGAWLHVQPASGTVPAGGSAIITASFDATGMYGGTYDARLVITSNDPVTPQVLVPARLHVTGVPDITVTPTSLSYGSLFIGASADKTLSVTNTGTDSLVVSAITSDQADYTAAPSNFALAPWGTKHVVVSFAPTTAGALAGQLTITSDDPDEGTILVPLSGVGVEPPVISVTPRALADTLATGESATQTVTVSNTGASNLEINILLVDVPVSGAAATVSTGSSPSPGKRSSGAGAASNPPLVEIAKGEIDTRSYPPMTRGSGGPDPFGYQWRDSNEPGGPVFNWIDVSSGYNLSLADDDFVTGIPLGFTFRYYGELYTTIGVGSNGWLSFNGSNPWFPSNVPAGDLEAGAIAPYARDLFPPGAAYIRFKTFGASPHRQFVVEYNHVPNYGGVAPKTFEVIFTEGINAIRFQYLEAADPPIGFGIESPDETMGMGNGGIGDLFISPWVVTNNYAIEFSGIPEWLTVSPTPATIPPGESLDLAATLDATQLAAGEYAAIISILSNDPLNPAIDVTVSLHVSAPGMVAAVAVLDLPTSFALKPNYPNPFNPTTHIAYDLPRAVDVRLLVYDVSGRQIAELVRGVRPAGRHDIVWDGRNASRDPVASGVYFYRLIAGDFVQTRKMVLLK